MLVSRTMPTEAVIGKLFWECLEEAFENGRSRSSAQRLTPVSKTLEEFNTPFSYLLENSLLAHVQ
jgi:hypothetical protein